MSKNFEKIKEAYEAGFYSLKMLRALVGKRHGITAEELTLISVEEY